MFADGITQDTEMCQTMPSPCPSCQLCTWTSKDLCRRRRLRRDEGLQSLAGFEKVCQRSRRARNEVLRGADGERRLVRPHLFKLQGKAHLRAHLFCLLGSSMGRGEFAQGLAGQSLLLCVLDEPQTCVELGRHVL